MLLLLDAWLGIVLVKEICCFLAVNLFIFDTV